MKLIFLGLFFGLWQNEPQLEALNKLLKSESPYGGYVELAEGSLIHHQKKNPGKRRIKLNDIKKVEYKIDKYDPNKGYYSVELVCRNGDCAKMKWLDGATGSYPALVFSFTSEKAAKQAHQLFEKLIF